MDYFSVTLAVLTLALFIAGYFGTKIIALEAARAVQLVALCLTPLLSLTPTQASLRWLSLSYGIFPLESYDYSKKLDRRLKGAGFNSNSFMDLLLPLLAVIGPVLVTVVLKLLSVTVYSQSKAFSNWWKYSLCEYVLYGILFTSYSSLANSVVAAMSFDEAKTLTPLYLAFGIFALCALVL